MATKNKFSRTFTEDSIEVGDWLALTKERTGKVVWKGNVEYAEGTHFGVELAYGTLGKHSGTYKGKQYFTCAEGRGMIVKMDRIRKKLPGDPSTLPADKWKSLGTSTLEKDETARSLEAMNDAEQEEILTKMEAVKYMKPDDVYVFLNTFSQINFTGPWLKTYLNKNNIDGPSMLQISHEQWIELFSQCEKETNRRVASKAKKARRLMEQLALDPKLSGIYTAPE